MSVFTLFASSNLSLDSAVLNWVMNLFHIISSSALSVFLSSEDFVRNRIPKFHDSLQSALAEEEICILEVSKMRSVCSFALLFSFPRAIFIKAVIKLTAHSVLEDPVNCFK